MTERPPRAPSPSALEWRLYLVTVLAGVYVLSWRAITGSPTPAAPAAPAPPPIARTATPAPLVLPPGWRLATTDDLAPPALAPPPPRAPELRPTRTRRIRTRSS